MVIAMDRAQFYALLGYVRSIRRLLIYILATMFGLLCFIINEFEHPARYWVLAYPVIFVFIAVVENQFARKALRELERQDAAPPPPPPVQPPARKKR